MRRKAHPATRPMPITAVLSVPSNSTYPMAVKAAPAKEARPSMKAYRRCCDRNMRIQDPAYQAICRSLRSKLPETSIWRGPCGCKGRYVYQEPAMKRLVRQQLRQSQRFSLPGPRQAEFQVRRIRHSKYTCDLSTRRQPSTPSTRIGTGGLRLCARGLGAAVQRPRPDHLTAPIDQHVRRQ